MATSSSYLIIYTILLLSNFHFSIATNNDTDQLALLQIKAKFNDPLGRLNSWNDSLHFCSWYGVTCGVMTQRVAVLNLESSKLSGSISPHIGNLSFLSTVTLDNNDLGGTIPPEICRLHRLKYLRIYNNSIKGQIPTNISGCYSLIGLGAGGNKLIGRIPDVMGSLINLKFLDLDKNSLTGTIPSSLGNLSSLSLLDTAYNQLVGNVPNNFGRLKNLNFLALDVNKLSGLLPFSIFNLSRMEHLDLGFNNLLGTLPTDIGDTLPLLNIFSIQNNSFEGVIPTSVSNLSNLRLLQLGVNNLHGKVPSLKNMVNLTYLILGDNSLGNSQNDDDEDLGFVSSLENSTMLSHLVISQNNFRGKFPRIICNFSALIDMYLEKNKITGEIPSCINKLVDLQIFSIEGNEIYGAIPDGIGKLQNLEGLYLNYNHLSGYIPSSIGNLTKLSDTYLSANSLVGPIPSSIGKCSNLINMYLSMNNLNGTIPLEILSLSQLVELDLSNNRLTGPLNKEVGQLRNIVELYVTGNLLSGEIPTSLAGCVELEILSMRSNFFEGLIPDSFSSLLSLRELNLAYNNLSGQIPNFLVHLPLIGRDISYNNLSGQVPITGAFSNATAISVEGNDMLCGGIPSLKLQKCHSHSHRKRSIHQVIIFGLLGIVILGISTSLCMFWYSRRSKKATTAITNNSMLSLSYQSLMKATDGFSSENLIGSGAFGTVFKGILDSDETLVAVKVFKLELYGAFKSFMAECTVLRNIRHRNLVKVITACSSIDYQGNDFKALIYEYMVNGSLEDWLYSNNPHRVLSFRQRLNIAVDVALAMEYLHLGYGASIVHCDIKPSNILLDQDMVAHVGDFGLAKFLMAPSQKSFMSSSLGLRGTVGYAPPEYGLGNEVSTGGDVYSFGILLMEIITGKRPTHEMFKDGLNLPNLVKAALPEKVSEIIDESSFIQDDEDARENNRMRMMTKTLEASTSVLTLALCCSTDIGAKARHEGSRFRVICYQKKVYRDSLLDYVFIILNIKINV